MSASVICLLGLIGWSILLTFLVVLVRVKPILGGTIVFAQDGSDLPGFAQRVTRAHGNSLENLAIPTVWLWSCSVRGLRNLWFTWHPARFLQCSLGRPYSSCK